MLDWKSLLTRWSRELMKTDLAQQLDPAPESPDWLGFAPATDDEIADLENRLGVILPPSYKAFLRTSNGWRRTTYAIGRVRPATEVNWFRVEHERWADLYTEHGSSLADEEYYDYPDGAALGHRAEHMQSLIQISDLDDGVYLLNPEAVTPDGDWEAWFFANSVPGAERHPSFAHLMLHEYKTFANAEGMSASGDPLPDLPTSAPDVPRVPAERVRRNLAKAPSFESLIEQMRAAEAKARAQAVRTFFGKLKGRPQGERRPDLVQPLTALFYSSHDPYVRAVCVHAIIEFADDSTSPEPLFDALSDPDRDVVISGIYALHYFPDSRALPPQPLRWHAAARQASTCSWRRPSM